MWNEHAARKRRSDAATKGRHARRPTAPARAAGLFVVVLACSAPAVGPKLRDYAAEPLVDPTERVAAKLRIVSLAPSATEIVAALGLADQLVARTPYCTHPAAVRGATIVGGLVDLDVERLVALRPDRILLSGHSRLQAEKLRAAGLAYTSLPDATLEDIFTAIRVAGDALGRPKTARRVCGAIRADLQRVQKAYARLPRRRVLVVLGELGDPPGPVFVAGPGSFYDDLLRLAGQRNVAPASHGAFAPLALESIVRADPEVIIQLAPEPGHAAPPEQTLARWRRVGSLSAVRERRIVTLAGAVYYVPGPRVAFILRDLCRALAGENP